MISVSLRVELSYEEFTVSLNPSYISLASDPAELAEGLLTKAVADATTWIEERKRKSAIEESES